MTTSAIATIVSVLLCNSRHLLMQLLVMVFSLQIEIIKWNRN